MLDIDKTRKSFSAQIDPKRKKRWGQFFTSSAIANFMASLFLESTRDQVHLLDAGIGVGSLSAAFIETWLNDEKIKATYLELTAYEIDKTFEEPLGKILSHYKSLAADRKKQFAYDLVFDDFIENTINRFQFETPPAYSHIVLNPPYRKINSGSRDRKLLRALGIETVNLYSGFLALAINSLAPNGELVAIVPRSFCNGVYYKSFRELLLSKTALRQIHIFDSRNKAFKDDDVLQENIIIHLIKSADPKNINISTSSDESFSDLFVSSYPFTEIVKPEDKQKFIFIPTKKYKNPIRTSRNITSSIKDIGLEVSTGPVVDFRVKEFTTNEPRSNTVPLLYPGHFKKMQVIWPNFELNKPNFILKHEATKKWLFPTGFYVVVKRFSSKEQVKRIVANVATPKAFNSDFIGFENHLNVFHNNKEGIREELAYGLVIYLNSSFVDNYFREFNGHTQVNAADLKSLMYPTTEILLELGKSAKSRLPLDQESTDRIIEAIL